MITIGSFECSDLTAQPFGYQEDDVQAGLTAKKWSINGLVDPEVWPDLLTEYDTWRDARLQDTDTTGPENLGTTVAFSGSGPAGQQWQAECWFTSAPKGDQSGSKIAISFEIVDAAQAAEIFLRQQEQEAAQEAPDVGEYELAGVTLALRKPIDGYREGPSISLSATGNHYATGPLIAERIKDIEGTTDLTGWNAIRDWYESVIATPLSENSIFPITPPSASAETRIDGGIKSTIYIVTIQLLEII
jgi:hypothetical protein